MPCRRRRDYLRCQHLGDSTSMLNYSIRFFNRMRSRSNPSILSSRQTQDLRAGGLKVTDAIVLLDREQGGEENLNTHDIQLHSLLKTQDVLDRLRANESIDQTTYDKTVAFLNAKNPSPSQVNEWTLVEIVCDCCFEKAKRMILHECEIWRSSTLSRVPCCAKTK